MFFLLLSFFVVVVAVVLDKQGDHSLMENITITHRGVPAFKHFIPICGFSFGSGAKMICLLFNIVSICCI